MFASVPEVSDELWRQETPEVGVVSEGLLICVRVIIVRAFARFVFDRN